MRPPVVLIFCIALAVLWTALASRPARAYQHVSNGGFESGLAGWSAAPTTDLQVVTSPEVTPAEGSASAWITIGHSDAIIRQRLSGALAPGTYELSLAVRSTGGGQITLSVLLGGTLQQNVVATETAGSDWADAGGAFVLNEAREAIVSLVVSGAPGVAVYVDDVRLDGAAPVVITPTATPEPATVTSVAGSLAATPTLPVAGSPTVVGTPTAIADVIGAGVRNASFEEIDGGGVPFAWEKYGGVLSSAGRARSGARAARLESATTATKWLHQAVSVDAGAWYELDAWIVHDDAAVASAFLRVSWYSSIDGSGSAIATDDSTSRLDARAGGYRRLTTGTVRAPDDARSARLRIMLAPMSEASASITADDVGWQRVAAPSPTPVSATPVSGDSVSETGSQPATSPHQGQPRTAARAPLAQRFTGAASGAPHGDVVINEILYDADSEAADGDAEWVEIYNAGSEAVDLAGWSLSDATSDDVLPSLVVAPRGFAIVAASGSFHDTYPNVVAPVVVLSGRIGNGLRNDGDRLLLADARGAVVDAVSWGDDASVLNPSIEDVPSGHSIEREFAGVDINRATDFIDNEAPSPGAEFAGVSTKPKPQIGGGGVVEVLEGGAARDWDWVAWAMVAGALSAVGGVVCWRTAFAVRERLR